ncbi:hypothetical protein ACFVXE_01320 [Streptomyces sp. NPDC058231]|uniref:hypothetical protein n=1 Tax=Streptomyces sp. NPDC058231 TaxID=3346392 RepID=UPI0036E367D4
MTACALPKFGRQLILAVLMVCSLLIWLDNTVCTLPLERAGSVIGIAVGGTIMSIVYRRAIEPSLDGVPGAVEDQARISAEQARPIAKATDRPALVRSAEEAFVHAMHVGAVWIMLVALFGAAVLLIALRSAKKPTASVREAESVQESGQEAAPSATGTALRAEADDRLAREGEELGTH